jgi:hypothetical protein
MDDRPMRIQSAPTVRASSPRRCSKRDNGRRATRRRSVPELDTTDARALSHALASVARERDARLFEVLPLDADLEGVFRYVVQR